jgi:hypothetical protein
MDDARSDGKLDNCILFFNRPVPNISYFVYNFAVGQNQ